VSWAALLLALGALGFAPTASAQQEESPKPAPEIGEAGQAMVERLGVALDNAPMTISSDELEALVDEQGAERIVFSRNVIVQQGSLRIDCERLEALYPRGESASGRPDTIRASGAVRITQPGREASCDEAVVDNRKQIVLCTAKSGKVALRRGEDVIQADSVEFNLVTGAVRARGGVTIQVQPQEVAE
jgi:lipopolysaccharide export system protein LptA